MEPCLYIHIPFCRRKCIYCDFYSVIYESDLAVKYIEAVSAYIESIRSELSTVYIGGGTPSALDVKSLGKLLKSLGEKSAGVHEFTIEANPESLERDKLMLLADHGVNRISIGLQSLKDEKLKKLGRMHNAVKAREAVGLAAKNGFKNISVDLIFGVWGEDPDAWKKELEEVVKMPVAHISCYALTYEKSTPLFEALNNRSVFPLDDEVVAAMYEAAIERLSAGGFKQYEVSNFARAGYECKHNMNYWENNPYIGIGASAVSYLEGVRSKNISDVSEYIKKYKAGKPLVESSEKLSPIRRARETASIKIRTKDGIDFRWFKDRTGFDFEVLEKNALKDLVGKELIKYKREGDLVTGIALRRKGFLFCDTVSSALL